MTVLSKPTVIGTRSGNAIHYTCPHCEKENSIIFEMPKEFYKVSRDGTCGQCKKRCTIVTPDRNY